MVSSYIKLFSINKDNMKKNIFLLGLLSLPLAASAQYSFDVLQYSQTQLRGTSRFVSMGGAFGALGGDLSTLGQNPAGIGVYRTSDGNVSFDVDFNSSSVGPDKCTYNKGLFTNVGFVGTLNMQNEVSPNLNIGFTYNRINSNRRHYLGYFNNLPTSVTNYFAEKAMQDGMTRADMEMKNPYFGGNARWDQIAAYNTDLITTSDIAGKKFEGLGYDGVYGSGEFEVEEWGHTDEYNFSIGGNIKNHVYWGLTLGLLDLVQESYKYYGEYLQNTVVYDERGGIYVPVDGNAALGIVNSSRTVGTGINGKIGLIFKPVNEFRVGVAFHSPTLYNMKDVYSGNISSEFSGEKVKNPYSLVANYPENVVRYQMRTPWKFIGSVATVIGRMGILSADYEYTSNDGMRILDEDGYELYDATAEIKSYLKPSHTIRVGAEIRVTPNFSLRAGYSFQTTAVEDNVKNDNVEVEVAGTNPAYAYDTNNQHITAGIGYHVGRFYFDAAYVNQQRKSNYHAFSGITDLPTVSTEVKDNNHRVQATIGYRF